jgi:hypothetical protein
LENPITEQRKTEEAAPRGTKKNRGKKILKIRRTLGYSTEILYF